MLNSFSFAQPLWLWLLLPIFSLLFRLWRSRVNAVSIAGQGVVAPHLARIFSLQTNKKANNQPIILSLMAAVFSVLALSSPQLNLSGEDSIKSPLIIALDLSDSMQNEQVDGFSHLQRSKLIIDQLLQKGINRPVSLIAFAGSAHQVLPISEQLALLRVYLGYLDASVMPSQGDDLNQLLLEINRIKDIQQLGYDLVILSDGFTVNQKAFVTESKDHHVLLLALNATAEEQGKEINAEVLTGKYLDSADNRLYQRLNALIKDNESNNLRLTNIGYWLWYPVLLIMLYFFRRGFSLQWLPLVLLTVSAVPNNAQAAFIDWWMTADQQGAYYFDKQNYKEAALRFEDEKWKAAAYVYAKDYKKAADIYQQQDDLTSLFNLAVTNSQAQNYHQAEKLYQLLLTIEPDNTDAENNLRIITALIKNIQETAEAQQEEEPPSDNHDTQEMVDEQLGADKDEIGQREVSIEGLSVDELLGSEQKKQQWLRDISRDPKLFLGAKFQAEFNKHQGEQSDPESGDIND
jgi:Ca-activated chloride channel homolog